MAYVTRQEGGKAQRILTGIGQAVSGVGQGMLQIEDMKRQKEELQMRKQEFEVRREQAALEMQEKSFGMFQGQVGMLMNLGNDTFKEYLKDPEYMGKMSKLFGKTGLPGNPTKLLTGFREAVEAEPDAYQELSAVANDIASSPALTPDQAKSFMDRGQAALKKFMPKLTPEGKVAITKFWDGTRNDLNNKMVGTGGGKDVIGYTETEEGYIPITDAQLSRYQPIEGKSYAGKVLYEPRKSLEEPTDIKKANEVLGKGYGTRLEKLPEVKNRLDNFDMILDTFRDVEMGPIKGMQLFAFMENVFNNRGIQLDFLLAQDQVKMFMDFAKEAGVRAIDTPQEQERVLRAIENRKQDPESFMKAVLKLKAAAKGAMIRTLEEQEYLKGGGTLAKFVPKITSQDAYYSPTGEVEFYDKGDAPEGYRSLRNIWKQKSVKNLFIPKGEGGDSSAPSITDADVDKMSKEELQKFLRGE